MTKEEALAIATPHLNKDGVVSVHVNQNGLYWIDSDEERMASYFESKKENYFVFKNEVVEPVSEEVTEEAPKKGRKKNN